MSDVSNITAFNTDPFNTWRSAFRECVKLSSKIIREQNNEETDQRLYAWCNKGIDRPFGDYSIHGANIGRAYGTKNINNPNELKKINDFDWLYEQFSEYTV